MDASSAHRTWTTLRGTREETARDALEMLEGVDPSEVAWIGDRRSELPEAMTRVEPRRTSNLLGATFAAAVVDIHGDFDPDVLGQVHGLVRGGGLLVFRLPPRNEEPERLREGRAAHPYGASDVGTHTWERFVDQLVEAEPPTDPPEGIPPASYEGTDEQADAIRTLRASMRAAEPARVALVADRGRGKSSAVGMALRPRIEEEEKEEAAGPGVAVTARRPGASAELFQSAGASSDPPRTGRFRYMRPPALLATDESFDTVVVDEAAQLPVPVLQRIVEAHASADLIFATTTHGYEGTGRGFAVRFLDWLEDRSQPVETIELEGPIRWAAGDPLEAAVFDTLLLDAEPAALEPGRRPEVDDVEHVRFDASTLAADERRLREVFGLLVRAHYRTRPSDLQKMLDAPNLAVHALCADETVVAATWVAEEGCLPPSICDELFEGQRRILGHALPEIFASKLGLHDAPGLEVIRSVRTAVHPELQRRGFGSRLIREVHDAYDPDLFGTVFSASPGVVDFRRHVGHEVIRLGSGRGRRTGQPSVAMMRPETDRARDLFRRLRRWFARKLPIQLELLEAGDPLPVDSALRERLRAGLPDPGPPPEEALHHHVAHYAFGPRTCDSAAYALDRFVRDHASALEELDPAHRSLIRARILERRGWSATAEAADFETVRAAMRAMRRAVRALVERVDADLEPP